MTWIGKHVLVLGAGRQGVSLSRFFVQRGARVRLADERSPEELLDTARILADLPGTDLEWVFGGFGEELLEGIDFVCVSGGVALSKPVIGVAIQRGLPLTNDSQLFFEETDCIVIGITGSAGKTTTTSLVGKIAQASVEAAAAPFRRVWVGGNIGTPLLSYVDEIQPDDLAVVELSSFQLELMTRSPQIAAVLNVTPNHLDRHGSMPAYTAAKQRILDYQGEQDVAILGRDDPIAWSLRQVVRGGMSSFGMKSLPESGFGAFVEEGDIFIQSLPGGTFRATDSLPRKVMPVSELRLRGEHNLRNVLAACAISDAAGISPEHMAEAARDFNGVAHRLEWVRSWGGAEWYNDSIATAPERTIAAIRSFDEPLVLLLGGRDKNLPWEHLAGLVKARVDHLIVFGEAAGVILAAMEQVLAQSSSDTDLPQGSGTLTIDRCQKMSEAVQVAASRVQPGDVVLLSPGGTSFDEFKDFEERGRCYVQQVNALR
jgi:UDP-N-acetylmuramoylalanine--D-glutamate ligase